MTSLLQSLFSTAGLLPGSATPTDTPNQETHTKGLAILKGLSLGFEKLVARRGAEPVESAPLLEIGLNKLNPETILRDAADGEASIVEVEGSKTAEIEFRHTSGDPLEVDTKLEPSLSDNHDERSLIESENNPIRGEGTNIGPDFGRHADRMTDLFNDPSAFGQHGGLRATTNRKAETLPRGDDQTTLRFSSRIDQAVRPTSPFPEIGPAVKTLSTGFSHSSLVADASAHLTKVTVADGIEGTTPLKFVSASGSELVFEKSVLKALDNSSITSNSSPINGSEALSPRASQLEAKTAGVPEVDFVPPNSPKIPTDQSSAQGDSVNSLDMEIQVGLVARGRSARVTGMPPQVTEIKLPASGNAPIAPLLPSLPQDSNQLIPPTDENSARSPLEVTIGEGSQRVTQVGTYGNPSSSAVSTAVVSQKIGQQIAAALEAGQRNDIEIRLEPEELGKLRIVLSTREGGMSVMVFAEKPETLELMRRNSEHLSAGMSDAGFEGADLQFNQSDNAKKSPDDLELPYVDEAVLDASEAARNAKTGTISDGLDLRL